MPYVKLTVPSIGSTTQRWAAVMSPESPSSPSNGIPGKSFRNDRSMRFWQRTSNSSLMSCCVEEAIVLAALALARITLPAARAARMAQASACSWWESFIAGLIHARGLQLFPLQLPFVLVEIDVVMAPFEFAALKINVIGAHGLLGRR